MPTQLPRSPSRYVRGVVAWRILPEPQQRLATVVPLLFGRGRVTRAERRDKAPDDELFGYDECWDYPTLEAAIAALWAWDPSSAEDDFPPASWEWHERRRGEYGEFTPAEVY